MDDFKFYEVGGKIRDELLGLTNKDVDYVAVPTEAVYSKIHPYVLSSQKGISIKVLQTL